jgi:hypothetical protein
MATSGYASEAMVEQKMAYDHKPKKVGFFKKKMRQWLLEAQQDDVVVRTDIPRAIGLHEGNSFDNRVEDGLTLTIHNANGGYVVNFRKYDRKTDRHSGQLYIIGSDQKFEEALAHCIAMECLTR